MRAEGSGVSCDPGGRGGGGASSPTPGTRANGAFDPAGEDEGLSGPDELVGGQPAARRHGRLAVEMW